MDQFLIALCGLPASGKSALAEAIQGALDSDVIIVRSDDWRGDSYYTDWRPDKEKSVRKRALTTVEKLIRQGKSVIHDDTNYYISMRHELFKVAVTHRCCFAVVYVSTPIDVALRWNREREGTRIPDSVIERINKRFDPPGERYLWDSSIMDVNMATQEFEIAIPKIVEILERLEPAGETTPQSIAKTEFDRLDNETRKIVSEFFESHPNLRGNKEISKMRRSLLKDVTRGLIPSKDANQELLRRLDRLL